MDEAKSNKKCLSDHTDSDDLIARKIRAATVFSRNFATQFFSPTYFRIKTLHIRHLDVVENIKFLSFDVTEKH
jgi:hypothetical protein